MQLSESQRGVVRDALHRMFPVLECVAGAKDEPPGQLVVYAAGSTDGTQDGVFHVRIAVELEEG